MQKDEIKKKNEKVKIEGNLIELSLDVGNDQGNSEQDIIIDGTLIKSPNMYAFCAKRKSLYGQNQENFINNIENDIIIDIMANDSISRTGTYYVGKAANTFGKAIRNIDIQNNAKYKSKIPAITTIGQIAGYAVKKVYELGKLTKDVTINVNVDMALALPARQYTLENVRQYRKMFLDETFKTEIWTPDYGVNISIVFNYVHVIPEGATTAFALRYTKNEKIFESYNAKSENEKKLNSAFFTNNENKRCLNVSIGEGTTDFPLVEGVKYNSDFLEGLDEGVGTAIERSLETIREDTKQKEFNRQKVSAIIKDKNNQYYDIVMNAIDAELENIAEDITQKVQTEVYRADGDIDLVCIYGGGSILMRKYLEKNLQQIFEESKTCVFYIDEEFAVDIEARGLYAFLKTPIYEWAKKKYLEER